MSVLACASALATLGRLAGSSRAGVAPTFLSPADFLADHTFRLVCLGTALIGASCGTLGALSYLRRQSLMSDVIAHAALPGSLAAFLLAATLGWDGRSMVILLIGATTAGWASLWCAERIAAASVVPRDAAMAVTLSLFFGAGLLMMQLISRSPLPGKGGIQDYVFGNASVLTRADVTTTAISTVLVLAVTIACFKEFTLRAFDADSATALGFSPRLIDGLMSLCLTVAIVMGVKTVGVILIVACVIAPPVAARQWTHSLPAFVTLSGCLGAGGAVVGSYLSVAGEGLPTGPTTVLTVSGFVALSLCLAPKRSLLQSALARAQARAQASSSGEATVPDTAQPGLASPPVHRARAARSVGSTASGPARAPHSGSHA